MLHTHAKSRGDPGEIGGDLAGTACLPLCHGAAGNADGRGQFILGPALVFPGVTDAGADILWISHSASLGQFS